METLPPEAGSAGPEFIYDWTLTKRGAEFLAKVEERSSWSLTIFVVSPIVLFLGLLLASAFDESRWRWITLVASLSISASMLVISVWLRRTYRPVLLYLRPYEHAGAGARFQRFITEHLDIRYRVVALADSWSNHLSIGEYLLVVAVLNGLGYVVAGLVWDGHLIDCFGALLGALFFALLLRPVTAHLSRRRVLKVGGSGMPLDNLEEWLLERRRSKDWWGRIRIEVELENWQAAVTRLAEFSDAAVMDVSRAGAGLAWELENVIAILGGRVILVADKEEFSTWYWQHDPKRERVEGVERMRDALSRHRVLFLATGQRRAQKRFGRALRIAVAEACSERTDRQW